MINRVLIFGLLVLTIFSCTSTVRFNKNDKFEYESTINIKVNKAYCWINEMPGSERRFNITGDILVLESPGYNCENVELKTIKILQNNLEVYFIKPVVRKDDSKTRIQFSTVKGLLPNENLDINKNVDIYFIFEEDDDIFTYLKKNCKIDRVQ
ncbi:MAG: hypothetical protein JEY94_01870 [Melioribacteraceae bacterium]|nr:hypothetical protein [Melioribacteraceae bacterium]